MDSWPGLLLPCVAAPSTADSRIYRRCVRLGALMSTPAERLPEPPRIPAVRYGAVKSRNLARNPAENRGALRSGKMAELRQDPQLLGFLGRSLVFLALAPHLRRCRVSSVSALVVGR